MIDVVESSRNAVDRADNPPYRLPARSDMNEMVQSVGSWVEDVADARSILGNPAMVLVPGEVAERILLREHPVRRVA